MPTARTKANRKYNEKAYDRLAVTVPIGQKAFVKKLAKEKGESVNEFVGKAILQRAGIDAWPKADSE